MTGRAWRAGLAPGDIVQAIDGVALAGLDHDAMFALAFEIAPEVAVRWTLLRAGAPLTVTAPAW